MLYIPTSKGVKAVRPENIIRVQASSNYCKIYFVNEYPLTVAKLLQWFEGRLSGDFFCRIHRGHIVNRKFIASVSDDNKLLLTNGDLLQVSKRKKTAFRRLVT